LAARAVHRKDSFDIKSHGRGVADGLYNGMPRKKNLGKESGRTMWNRRNMRRKRTDGKSIALPGSMGFF